MILCEYAEQGINAIIKGLIEDFNYYSKLVAVDELRKKEADFDNEVFNWRCGRLYQINQTVTDLVSVIPNIKLEWDIAEESRFISESDFYTQIIKYNIIKVSYV